MANHLSVVEKWKKVCCFFCFWSVFCIQIQQNGQDMKKKISVDTVDLYVPHKFYNIDEESFSSSFASYAPFTCGKRIRNIHFLLCLNDRYWYMGVCVSISVLCVCQYWRVDLSRYMIGKCVHENAFTICKPISFRKANTFVSSHFICSLSSTYSRMQITWCNHKININNRRMHKEIVKISLKFHQINIYIY